MKTALWGLLFCGIASSAMAQELDSARLKMAGAGQPQTAHASVEAQPTEAESEEALTPEQQREKIVLEYIQKRPAFKDPLLAKRMYSTMRGLDDAIQKAHENALKAFDDDPEKRQAEQKKLDEQTPIRFEFKAEDTHLLSQEINEDPQAVVARMLAGFKTPDINEETIAVQRRQMDRMNKQFTDKMGMDVQEYQDLWRKQQEEDAQKRIPGTDYDLTDVILQEDEISVSK